MVDTSQEALEPIGRILDLEAFSLWFGKPESLLSSPRENNLPGRLCGAEVEEARCSGCNSLPFHALGTVTGLSDATDFNNTPACQSSGAAQHPQVAVATALVLPLRNHEQRHFPSGPHFLICIMGISASYLTGLFF